MCRDINAGARVHPKNFLKVLFEHRNEVLCCSCAADTILAELGLELAPSDGGLPIQCIETIRQPDIYVYGHG